MFEKIYQDHAKWINTTLKFGCTKEEAEDIVGNVSKAQDMVYSRAKENGLAAKGEWK